MPKLSTRICSPFNMNYRKITHSILCRPSRAKTKRVLAIFSNPLDNDKSCMVPSSRTRLTAHRFVGQTSRPGSPFMIPNWKALLWHRRSRSVALSNDIGCATFLSPRGGSIQDTTTYLAVVDLSVGDISGRKKYKSNALLASKSFLHEATFNDHVLNRTEQKDGQTGNHEVF